MLFVLNTISDIQLIQDAAELKVNPLALIQCNHLVQVNSVVEVTESISTSCASCARCFSA